jgi:phosphoglycerol transferase MdoB-like AlkP superfamily enzyme
MKKTHLIFGVCVVLAFLLTGQYMDKFYNHMVGVPDAQRLLFRTRHIFILLAGLLNLGIGAYFTYRIEIWQRTMQLLGSLLIFAASCLFLIAFFYEPNRGDLRTPLSHWGTYTIAAGALLHVFSGIQQSASPNVR